MRLPVNNVDDGNRRVVSQSSNVVGSVEDPLVEDGIGELVDEGKRRIS